jgi:hypothetical protein
VDSLRLINPTLPDFLVGSIMLIEPKRFGSSYQPAQAILDGKPEQAKLIL